MLVGLCTDGPLRRLSRWCALCDLQMLLGGSRSGLSRVFRFMLTMVNQRYGKLVSNVKIWSEYFQAFSQHFRGMGFPFDNGVLFVDDTLKETHGYSYQAAVFPNGVRAVAAILFCVTPLIPIYDYYCMEQVWRAAGNRGLGTKVVRSSVCVLRCVHTWLCTYAPRDTHSSSLSCHPFHRQQEAVVSVEARVCKYNLTICLRVLTLIHLVTFMPARMQLDMCDSKQSMSLWDAKLLACLVINHDS